MNVAISLRLATEDWEQGSAYVVEAERLGAHSVWTPEAWGHDAVAPLAFLAARTSRILLGTSFMPEHARVFLDHLAVGAKRAGRSLDALDLHVSAGVVAFSDDVARLVPPRKPGLAFSLGAMGSRRHNFYNDAYRRAGYADVAAEVQRLWLDEIGRAHV